MLSGLGFYILQGHIPVEATMDQYIENLKTLKPTDKIVNKTHIGGIEVSTVFLGFTGIPGPVLFETMIFGSDNFSDYQERYSTWEQAEAGHSEAVELVKSSLLVDKSSV